MHSYPSPFRHFAFMQPQNTWVWSPNLLSKGGSARAKRDAPRSSWATCSSVWQHLELNSCSLVFEGNVLYIIHPFTGHQWEESEYIFFTSTHETFVNIDESPAEFSLLKVKQSQLSQPLTLSDAPIPETSLWAFSGFAPIHPCLSCTGDPKTGSRTPDVISQLLNREERSPPSTCWLYLLHYSPRLVHGNIACTCSICCPAGVTYILLYLPAFQMVSPKPVLVHGAEFGVSPC